MKVTNEVMPTSRDRVGEMMEPGPDGPIYMVTLLKFKERAELMFKLDAEGWRILTFRWGLFFLVMAVVNEVIWRNFSTDFWITFKVWGNMPLSIVFTLAQLPLMQRHALPEETSEETA